MTVPNILNEKQLEKQVKLLDTRLAELRTEIDTLEKRKEACLLLLGTEALAADAEGEAAKKATSAKSGKKSRVALDEVPLKIREVLSASDEPLSADGIYDALKSQHGLPGESPVAVVYEALEKNAESFEEDAEGRWSIRAEGEAN